ncbi:hypothetical protein PUN28_005260 [Cardiocondyla obscurior]|uniref:Uncharacterized protein n=1 Tax=Cardiocondyla obscurior TaxID=286306 RepID=A0AAW2GJW7_9HYME
MEKTKLFEQRKNFSMSSTGQLLINNNYIYISLFVICVEFCKSYKKVLECILCTCVVVYTFNDAISLPINMNNEDDVIQSKFEINIAKLCRLLRNALSSRATRPRTFSRSIERRPTIEIIKVTGPICSNVNRNNFASVDISISKIFYIYLYALFYVHVSIKTFIKKCVTKKKKKMKKYPR